MEMILYIFTFSVNTARFYLLKFIRKNVTTYVVGSGQSRWKPFVQVRLPMHDFIAKSR
jgi:hypothetical protein